MLAMLMLLTAGAGDDAPRKVAVVYSSWSDYTFRDEWDAPLKRLGWAAERFENTKTADLVARLAEFDVVVAASVANYEHTVDMAPYADAWRQWLQGGGLLLITDASYDSVLDKWVGRLGPEFALRTEPCKPAGDDRRAGLYPRADGRPLIGVPNDLASVLSPRAIWSHLATEQAAWDRSLVCADGGLTLVSRRAGRGLCLVTSHFAFRGEDASAAAASLVANAWHTCPLARAELDLQRVLLGEERPGPHRLELELANTAREPRTYQVVLSVREGDTEPPAETRANVALPGLGSASLRLPFAVETRGEVGLRLEVGQAGQPPVVADTTWHIGPLFELTLLDTHLYPNSESLRYRTIQTPAIDPDDDVRPQTSFYLDGQAEPLSQQVDPTRAILKLPPLQPGQHTIEGRLARGGKLLASVKRSFTVHPLPRVQPRPSDLTTLVDGKPFFPLGFYHVSWPFAAEDRLACLREIAAAGYNTIHASLKQLDEWQPFLDEAQRLGVKVITEFGVDRAEAIRRYRGHPAVLAWNPGDEPDGTGIKPDEMLARHDAIKELDATVPTYMTLCVPSTYSKYAGAAEIIAPDPYPVHQGSANVDEVYQHISAAVKAATPLGRPIWAIPQAFGYDKPNTWRVPTPAEERAMTYLALIAGAKGLVYYTYRDADFDMRAHPELWGMMKQLPGEIRRLEPWLLGGSRSDLTEKGAKVRVARWSADQRHLLVLANPTDTPQPVDLSLASPCSTAAELLPGQPPTLKLANGRLQGTLGPLAVEVVELR